MFPPTEGALHTQVFKSTYVYTHFFVHPFSFPSPSLSPPSLPPFLPPFLPPSLPPSPHPPSSTQQPVTSIHYQYHYWNCISRRHWTSSRCKWNDRLPTCEHFITDTLTSKSCFNFLPPSVAVFAVSRSLHRPIEIYIGGFYML